MTRLVLACFVLFLSGVVFLTLWRLSVSPVNRYFVVHEVPTGPLQVLWLLFQVYVVAGWAAACIAILHHYVDKPGTFLGLVSYIPASFFCVAPLYDPTPRNSNAIAVFSFIAFLAFVLFPILTTPWHWFLHYI